MKSKVYHIFSFVLFALLLISCEKDEVVVPGTPGGDLSQLNLIVRPQSNALVTKAASSEFVEERINNLYVFILDTYGSVVSRKYFSYEDILSFTVDDIIYLPSIHVSSGTKREIALVANIDFDIMDISNEELDDVESSGELHAIISSMVQNAVERGNNFLMSGFLADVEIAHGGSTSVIVPMTRVDAKVTFNVKTKDGVVFEARDWTVVNLPKAVELFKSESEDNTEVLKEKSKDLYFSSQTMKFEGKGAMMGKTFTFYMLEHKIKPDNIIPTTENGVLLTEKERYALREKQHKLPIEGSDFVENGNFVYAPEDATYVKIRGSVSYQEKDELGKTTYVNTDATYYVHLGCTNNDVNDYAVSRNTHYVYNITINSVNDIIVEVDANDGAGDLEPRPGAEGMVIRSHNDYQTDAYFGTSVIEFRAVDINSNISWYVRTPFGEGSGFDANPPKDIKWVYFKLNKISENGIYQTSFETYPGRSYKYSDDINFSSYADYVQFVQDYKSGNDKMLNVEQLVNILNKAKEYKTRVDELNMFDASGKFTVTAFVNEFYYDYDPENEGTPLSEKERRNYWKKFVNCNKRVMNILSETTYSKDAQSCKSIAFYSLRQSSIETMYNIDDPEDFTAWGTQTTQDNNLYLYDPYTTIYPKWNEDGNNSRDNGRKNSLRIIKELRLENGGSDNADLRWDEIIEPSTWTIKDKYNYAKYIWIAHNRDLNGNGVIDDEEILWYLAAESQLSDLWIGINSYDHNARLYQADDWSTENQRKQYYCSSTMSTRNKQGRDIVKILWSSEGASFSDSDPNWLEGVDGARGVNAKVHYRSLRNLGIKDDNFDDVPDDIAQVSIVVRDGQRYPTIKLRRLDRKSIRNYFQKHELALHDERSSANRPYNGFEVYYRNLTSEYSYLSYIEKIANGESFCPEGYRLPNQRELILMVTKMSQEINNNGGWPKFSACRTMFSFYDESNGRIGFSTNNDASGLHLLLINKKGEGTPNIDDHYFRARCVRDITE